jgi:predicted unusual protein kinase regulating ubiquinone biosynthesis (AarF/ABC1/UbiB family)
VKHQITTQNIKLIRLYESEWNKEVQRFKNVFKPRSGNVKHYYMAGNHDLGFGDGIKLNVVDRFEKEFGDTSYELSFESHSMVVIDSVAMSSTNAQINQKSRDFVRQLRPSDKSRILFSHVPLYRQPSPISGTLTAPAAEDMCGPLRQKSKQIRQGVGYQYQNLMTKELTDFILTQQNLTLFFLVMTMIIAKFFIPLEQERFLKFL